MRNLIVKLVSNLAVIFLVFLASRIVLRSLPGDPLAALLEETGSQVDEAFFREIYSLGDPFFVALWNDVRAVTQGSFGVSLVSGEPIRSMLPDPLMRTLELSVATFFLSLILSLVLGLLAVRFRAMDRVCSFLGMTFAATPLVWIVPLFMIAFCFYLPIFDLDETIVLPAIVLAVSISSLWSRWIRDRVREQLTEGGSNSLESGARARGVPEWKILWKYGFRPVAGPLVAHFGTQFGFILTGSLVMENLFHRPGLGHLFIKAVLSRDYPVVEASILLSATFCIFGTSLGDSMRGWLDPREEKI